MYIYSFTATFKPGHSGPGIEWLSEFNAAASQASGFIGTVHQSVAGFPQGTGSISVRVDSIAALSEGLGKVSGDAAIQALMAKGADFISEPGQSEIAEVLVAENLGDTPAQFHHLIQTQITGGHFGDAMAWGAEITQYVAQLTGRASVFMRAPWGPVGTVGWLMGFDDAAQVDDAQAKINADPGYLERIDAAGDFFVPTASRSGLIRRVG